jgi:redox-sensing transcriptional repressor
VLTQLLAQEVQVVSSQQLGSHLQMTPAQIRKDLSYFGRFGKQGRGYSVQFLLDELRHILGLDREWHACLVGVGRLGRAIVNYPGFGPESFQIIAVFDNDPQQVGTTVGGLMVRPMSELDQTVDRCEIKIGIVAVPSHQAQSVIDRLLETRVRGILNYAPVAPQIREGVVIRNVDPVLSLQSMTFYLKNIG